MKPFRLDFFRKSKNFLTAAILTLAVLGTSGCLALQIRNAEVSFEDPAVRLQIISQEPTLSEKDGVLLRYLPALNSKTHFREENIIFASIHEGKGLQMKFVMDRIENWRSGSGPDSYILHAETVFEGEKGSLLEEKAMTPRGEILKFIRGFHHSRIGNFDITEWSKTPEFPEKPVKIGESWTFEERMAVRIKSFWFKEIDPQPYRMTAVSTLEGFATVRGQRAAVVRTKTSQTKREHFKIFFKEILFDIASNIEEISYLDYTRGTLLGRVTKTQSQTKGLNFPLTETGQSQSILYPLQGDPASQAKISRF